MTIYKKLFMKVICGRQINRYVGKRDRDRERQNSVVMHRYMIEGILQIDD